MFSQYLIAFGIKQEQIESVLDNDPCKIGHRLYGTSLYTHSPSILKEKQQPIVILKAGVYTEEIKENIIKNHNSTTKFI